MRDDNPAYPVFGLWIYLTHGTGVFYDLGNTLRARNKIHSLFLLGKSARDIAAAISSLSYYKNPTAPSVPVVAAAGGPDKVLPMIEYLLADGRNYELDRINNLAGLDEQITTLARAQGYDSVQFQIQANGHGGFAHEIVFVSPSPLRKEIDSTWGGWPEMAAHMSLDAAGCAPCTPRPQQITTCAEQHLDASCEGNPSVFLYRPK